MLEIKRIRAEKEAVIAGLRLRNWPEEKVHIVDDVLALDDKRKATQTNNDMVLSKINSISKEIGQLFKEGKQEEANSKKSEVSALKEEIKTEEEHLKNIIGEIEALLLKIPNIPHPSVPPGKSEDENEVIKEGDIAIPVLQDDAKPHWDLGEALNILDFQLGVKITGAGFPLFRGKGAKLQRALIQFFLDEASKAGYEEFVAPLLVNADSARGTGQLPDKDGQMYHAERDDLYLIPTAEVPLTNVFRNDIVDQKQFPIKITGYTPCFRREAGSYGADVKGLNRVHQFDKIEIVQITHPEESYSTLDSMVSHVENLLIKLELPYRILRLCGGDVTFASALTYDFEVFAAAQKKWLEVSSVSNFETFQSTRLKLRYRDENKKTQLAHTLNGSALALARIIAALLENNQTEKGIKIPKVLVPYTGFEMID